jgi:hypothetical protein
MVAQDPPKAKKNFGPADPGSGEKSKDRSDRARGWVVDPEIMSQNTFGGPWAPKKKKFFLTPGRSPGPRVRSQENPKNPKKGQKRGFFGGSKPLFLARSGSHASDGALERRVALRFLRA